MALEESVEDSNQVPQGNGKRERSSIQFPYQDLEGAISIAKSIHALHGSSSQLEQIAAYTNQSPNSSGFRVQVASAKTFGLVTTSQGTVTLTTLGRKICDPQQEQSARADAFLSVPLYKAVYEKFKGMSLPPSTGLETALGDMGVAAKQTERARQTMQRSAQQAGFFQFGNDRLVFPSIKQNAPNQANLPPEEPPSKKKRKDDEEELHPFIKGLLTKLPEPDAEWTQEARAKWLETAANIFDLLYKNSDDNNRVISIRVEKDSAKQ